MSSVGNIVNFGEPFSDSDNKWSWNWLGIVVERDEKDTEHVREQVRKIDKDSLAWCLACKCQISYGGWGVSNLTDHLKTPKHKKARNSLQANRANCLAFLESERDEQFSVTTRV